MKRFLATPAFKYSKELKFHTQRISESASRDKMKKRVVVDVDAGTDDAVALLLLLTLEPEKDYQVVGVTCTHGNTTVDNVCRNVLTTLQHIQRLDVPVYRGAEESLIPVRVASDNFHGENGFGGKYFPPPQKTIENENAVAALNRLAAENEGIVLICLGPLTNAALALRTYPEFCKNLKEVHIMGGNVNGVGNSSCSAEFNFFKDPEAAHIVLSTVKCPVTILPWETCAKRCLTLEERFNDIGTIPNPHVRMLNEIERVVYKNEKSWISCDPLLAASFLDKGMIVKSRELHLTVELQGMYTRGQAVVDHTCKNEPNVIVIEEVDLAVYKKLLYKMASYVPKNK